MSERISALPPLRIGDRTARVPIVQGGMGVGISLSGLASAVAREGGIGVIAGAGLAFLESPKGEHYAENNLRVLRREIRAAREQSEGGLIGINLMVALTDYAAMCRVAVEEGVDLIFSGAGLPLHLPAYAKGTDTRLVPVVSSARAAALLCSTWRKKHDRLPDAVVVEGPRAGGHLGFSREQIDRAADFPLEKLLVEVLEAVAPFQTETGGAIPVIAGGGVFDGADIARCLHLGASGVQMASRFVCTHECDAALELKQAYVDARDEDVTIVSSPVGMPGRALRNRFLMRLERGDQVHTEACPYHCLKTCDPATKPYCIALALNQARRGHLDQGLIFAGANVSRITAITSVRDLIDELVEEAQSVLPRLRLPAASGASGPDPLSLDDGIPPPRASGAFGAPLSGVGLSAAPLT